jgi:hypothetical protein
MIEPPTWQSAFVATTLAIGDSVDDARASLGPADLRAASAFVARVSHPDRRVRARTLAATLARVAADVETARLA